MIFTREDTTKQTENLEGKFVLIDESYFKEEYKNAKNQLFYATGGFGCDPNKLGRAVFGRWFDGESNRVNREYILGVATEESISTWEKLYGLSREVFYKGKDE